MEPITLHHRRVPRPDREYLGRISLQKPYFLRFFSSEGCQQLRVTGSDCPRSSSIEDLIAHSSEMHEDGESTRTVKEQLEWCGVEHIPADDIPLIVLPHPICKLILEGSWKYILLRTSWHHEGNHLKRRMSPGPLADWPPDHSESWDTLSGGSGSGSGQLQPNETVIDFDSGVCDRMAFAMRQAGSGTVAAGEVQFGIDTLEAWSRCLRAHLGCASRFSTHGKFLHSFQK